MSPNFTQFHHHWHQLGKSYITHNDVFIDDALLIKGITIIIGYSCKTTRTKYTISSSMTSIGLSAFYNDSKLSEND